MTSHFKGILDIYPNYFAAVILIIYILPQNEKKVWGN